MLSKSHGKLPFIESPIGPTYQTSIADYLIGTRNRKGLNDWIYEKAQAEKSAGSS
jgi:hypothetical protein